MRANPNKLVRLAFYEKIVEGVGKVMIPQKFNFVSWEGDSDAYLEPVQPSNFEYLGDPGSVRNHGTEGVLIVGIEITNGSEVTGIDKNIDV